MALIECPDCKHQVSTDAQTCPQCGARTKPKPFKWWLWAPLGLVAMFLLYGLSVPEYVQRAREMRKACEAVGGAKFQCDSMEQKVLEDGRRGGPEKCPPNAPGCSWGQ